MSSSEEITKDLVSDMAIEQVFQKHVVDGASFFFREVHADSDIEYTLRHELAVALDININDVLIVGSAKMGFSLKSEKFTKFDEKYRRTSLKRNMSDIDIAIVNRRLFDRQSEVVYQVSCHFSDDWIYQNWKHNMYYDDDKKIMMKGIESLFHSYVKYLARGWFRMDFLPNLYLSELPWRPIGDAWYQSLGRKISIGLYSDWYYLKHYQMDNLQLLREKFMKLEIEIV